MRGDLCSHHFCFSRRGTILLSESAMRACSEKSSLPFCPLLHCNHKTAPRPQKPELAWLTLYCSTVLSRHVCLATWSTCTTCVTLLIYIERSFDFDQKK
jgi:hypothetical protein